MTISSEQSTVDPQEIENFSRIADEWWNPTGKFAPLHAFNKVRVGYIRETLVQLDPTLENQTQILKGKRVLDIGCGGGILSESLARLGADLVSVDASEKNIKIAAAHAEKSGLEIDYRHSTAESLAEDGEKFDIVCCMEVIEHVANVPLFMEMLGKLTKENGQLFMSTINRTVKSYALAIVGAEYILRLMPVGTHQWNKFITPAELANYAEQNGFELGGFCGATYNPLTKEMSPKPNDLDVNYLMWAEKPSLSD